MVLIVARRILLVLALSVLLNACSHLQPTHEDNRIPESTVIPASTDQPARIETSKPASTPSLKEPILDKNRDAQTSPLSPDNTSTGKTAAPKKSEVLDAILQQARKAIDNGQWLRAQHHLEHALRIAPQHAQTFYLYALVYHGLGIPDQAKQMLKRALFLSRPDSDLHQTVKQELDALAP